MTSRYGMPAPLCVQEQGGVAVGGTVSSTPGTLDPVKQTRHGDHAYVFCRVPVNLRKLPPVHLPERGIRGNAPSSFSDPSTLGVAEPLSAFLTKQDLD